MRVATRTISGLYDGATTAELDRLSIQTAADLIAEEPQYSRLAARLLAAYTTDEVAGQGIHSFSEGVAATHAQGLIGEATAAFVAAHAAELDTLIDPSADRRFEYFGLRTVADRYLLRHPYTRLVLETPQHWLLRVACGLARDVAETGELYRLMSSLAYLPSSPTLFNSGTAHAQMSSCYLIDSPRDDLDSIYQRYAQVARLSKFAGGIGIGFSRVRSRGALIRGTNGRSNGIVPWLRTLDASVAAVNQGGRRKGAACVYLEPWHPDVEEFLELRDNTGEDARRTHNLNLVGRRVRRGLPRRRGPGPVRPAGPGPGPVRADDAHARPDRQRLDDVQRRRQPGGEPDRRAAQRDPPVEPVHRSPGGLLRHRDRGVQPRLDQLGPARRGVRDGLGTVAHHRRNRGPIPRPRDRHQLLPHPAGRRVEPAVAPGWAGRDGPAGRVLHPRAALRRAAGTGAVHPDRRGDRTHRPGDSVELAREHGPHPAFDQTRAARGVLHLDHFDVLPTQQQRWAALRAAVAEHGLRNALLIAIAPTATIASIASIAGCYECIEPQVSTVFKRETLSGEFLQVNSYLVAELKHRGLWTPAIREKIKCADGSVQGITALPEDIRARYRTAWELLQRALIDMVAARTPYIDQSQSLNLFLAHPTVDKLSSMYAHAWDSGLKTTYYLRSRPATRFQQATVTTDPVTTDPVCSLENPETCEACQ